MVKKLLLTACLLIAAVLALVLWSYQGAVLQVPVTEKVVALTFDDGPNPPYTAELLALLEERGVRASFFPKARNVEAFPEAAREVVRAGHEIGNHSYDHLPMTSLSKADMQAEIVRSNQVLEEILGVQARLFRPPFGVQSLGVKLALRELGMVSVLASAHGSDWEEDDPERIAAAVLADIEPGVIVLLHDGHGDVADPHTQDSRSASVAATGIVIEKLREQGYRLVTVGELLTMGQL